MSTTQPIKSVKQLEQFKKYYQEVSPDSRNYALIILGLNTALRISDILRLHIADVWDFRQHCFNRHIEIAEKKTGKNTSVYINREVRQALSSCHLTSLDPGDALFPSHKYKGAVHAGLPEHISCHSLRKTFGYHAWKQSVPPAMLMDIYNHSSYQITKRYLGIDQDDKDQVFEKIRL